MPSMHASGDVTVALNHKELGRLYLHAQPSPAPAAAPSKKGEVVEIDEEVKPDLLFTENETNFERLYGGTNRSFAKDAFHDHIIPSHRPPPIKKQSVNGKDEKAAQTNGSEGDSEHSSSEHSSAETTPQPERVFVNPDRQGTKAAAHYVFRDVPANGGCAVVRLKLSNKTADQDPTVEDEELFDATVDERRQDADEFYARFNSSALNDDLRSIMRQALSGMLWTKQFYYFVQKEWIEGDPGQPPPPPERKWIRNRDWKHMYIEDVLSMPDKWEVRRFHRSQSSALRLTARPTVPLLRGVGHGLPLHPARNGRPGLCEEPARHHDARVVHEARRRAPGLRVEVRRAFSCMARFRF